MSITIRSAQTIRSGLTLQGGNGITDSSVVLWLDATNPLSYPGTGTTWYDLSPNQYNATLYNGASAVGNAINFDYNAGQYAALAPNSMFGGDFTAIGWVYIRSYQSWSRLFDFGNGAGSSNVIVAITDAGSGNPVYSNDGNLDSTQAVPLNQWVQIVATQAGSTGTIYINGTSTGTYTNEPFGALTRYYNYIGRSNWGNDGYLDGKIAQLKMFSRALSTGEILADYNYMVEKMATIVSSGLQLYLDAGNTSSYSSGTIWTDIVNGKQFTLYNGPTYDTDGGGSFDFTSTSEQYAEAPGFPSTLSNWSLEAWYYSDQTAYNPDGGNSPCIITEIFTGGPINYTLGNCSDSFPNIQVGHWDGSSFYPTPQGNTLPAGQWYHLVGTFDGTAHRLYVNGTQVGITETTSPAASSGAGIRLMRRWDARNYMSGKLSIVRIYNNAMNNTGVAKNFNTERGRFGI